MLNFTLVKTWVNLDLNRCNLQVQKHEDHVGWADMIIPKIKPCLQARHQRPESQESWKERGVMSMWHYTTTCNYLYANLHMIMKHCTKSVQTYVNDTVMQVLAKMKITFVGSIITKSQVVITNFMLNTWNQQWHQQWLEKGKISTWRVQVHKSLEKRKKKCIMKG